MLVAGEGRVFLRPVGLLWRLPILDWKLEWITMDFMIELPHIFHGLDSV